jgi:hypothetical protein
MAEILTLTAPVVTTRTTYRLSLIILDWDGAFISIRLVGSDGGDLVRTYSGAAATAKMTALNTANFTVTSLQKKVFQMLLVDFPELAGVISGTPI